MGKTEDFQNVLLTHSDQEQFLKAHSCLPGPRSNLELLYAFIEISEFDFTVQLLNKQYPEPPVNSPDEFVLCCAVASCGKHILDGKLELVSRLKDFASDSRWRIRESVAMALQHIGKYNIGKLQEITVEWETGNFYEQRAIAAGLCEPAILKTNAIKIHTLNILRVITINLSTHPNKSSESCKTLIKALCYCWSVAIAAQPVEGKSAFEALLKIQDKTVQKIIKENLKKNRLKKLDQEWVNQISEFSK